MSPSEIKGWIPPKLLPVLRRLGRRSLRFAGGYQSWEYAQRDSLGYSHADILERVARSTRKVISGEFAYERDGYCFSEIEYSYPLAAMLMHAALANGGDLDVIDYGGSLGSTYRQCRPLLDQVKRLRWHVVEQDHYVELGRKEFEDGTLSFHSSIQDVQQQEGGKQLLLLSSVLKYLRQPALELPKLLTQAISHVVIDRTPMHRNSDNRLCVQHVPEHLNRGSYPCWIFSKADLLGLFPADWKLLAEFPSLDGEWRTDEGLDFEYRGMCLTMDRRL